MTNARSFRARLTALRGRRRFVRWGETARYAEEIRDLLDQLQDEAGDPSTGLELVAAFYRTDAALLGSCDDSDGIIGDIFRLDARDLFARYAARCEDKDWLAGVVFDLVKDDDFGVRDSVLSLAATWLPETHLRSLADRMWEAAGAAGRAEERARGERTPSHWYLLVEAVARQLNDARLFERARRTWHRELGPAACTDIARAWMTAGDADTALAWLDRVTAGTTFMREEREELRSALYRQLGRHDQLEQLLWERLRRAPSAATLQELLEAIGPGCRDEVVAGLADTIVGRSSFTVADALFLMDTGLIASAAAYVVERRSQVDGSEWPVLLPLAERLMAAGQPLGATVIYRALLDSILARAQSPTYGHGVRYLRLLGKLAQRITEWAGVPAHDDYAAAVRERHARKHSFWRRYEGGATT